MTSYTFFFNKRTFEEWQSRPSASGADRLIYLAGKNARPMNGFADGDEVFIVGIRDGRVRLAGRLIVDGIPLTNAQAVARLGKADLLDKEIYVVAKPDSIDRFRGDVLLTPALARDLELYTSNGAPANVEALRVGRPDPNQFRVPLRLSERSADVLRRVLGLEGFGSSESDARMLTSDPDRLDPDAPLSGADDDEYRTRAIKTRRGQMKFREALLAAYGGKCLVSRCGVVDLLEAAHITPHADLTDYRVSNGLLLRADIHTLFDLNLIGIDGGYRVRVSPKLRNSEYWTYEGRRLDQLPDRLADSPDRDGLVRRLEKLVKG